MNQRGQSTVEYILLLAVVISLVYVVINSARFQDIIGEGGSFAAKMKNSMEWNYRFGSQGMEGFTTIQYPGGRHPTYFNSTTGNTHFIGPIKPYGE